MSSKRCAASCVRAALLSSIATATLLTLSAEAQAALSPDDLRAIQQEVASSLSAANTKNPGDIPTIAQQVDGLTESLIKKYGSGQAKDVAGAVVKDALDDGAPAEAVGRGMALAALNLGKPDGDAVADGVGRAGDASTLQAFNQNATASNTTEGTQLSQEAEQAQGEAETAGNRREPQRNVAIGSVIIPSTGTAGGPTTTYQPVTSVSGGRPVDPYFQPKGIPLGRPFRLFTNLYGSGSYDSNVYRSPSPKLDSFFFTVNPTVVLDYDTSRVKLDLYGDMDLYRYTSQTQVDTTTYNAGLRGQWDISEEAVFNGNVSQSLLDEALQSANTVTGQKRANQFNLFDSSGVFTYKPGRIGISFGGGADLYSFTATPLFGGVLQSNTDRDNNVYRGFASVSYDFSPGYSVFARGTYNDDHYNTAVADRTGAFRSSHGYEVDGGVNLLLGDLANGEIYAGYLKQDYIQFVKTGATVALKDVSGLDFGAHLNWFPTELLALHLSASRQLQNTVQPGSSAGDDRNVTLSADYELLREFSLTGNVGYDDTNYKGAGRDDKSFLAGVGGKWLINHYLWANFNYEYAIRSSSGIGGDYNDNLVSVGLNFQI